MKNIFQFAIAILIASTTIKSLHADIIIRKGRQSDWPTVATIATTMHNEFLKEIGETKPARLFQERLNSIKDQVFSNKLTFVMYYQNAEICIGFSIFKIEPETCSLFVNYVSTCSCYYNEALMNYSQLKTTFSRYIFECYDGVSCSFTEDLDNWDFLDDTDQTTQPSDLNIYKDSWEYAGFTSSNDSQSLDRITDQQIRSGELHDLLGIHQAEPNLLFYTH